MPALFAALALTVAGCGGSRTNGAGAARPLAAYSGHAADLFDDTIDAAAVGLDYDKGFQPRTDPTLRERAQTADGIVRVRVSTITTKSDGAQLAYQVGLHTVERLGGANPPPTDFTVLVTKASDSHGILKSFEGRLVGYAFVAFVRDFARADGESDTHFHLAPDTKDVRQAVGDALLLGDLK